MADDDTDWSMLSARLALDDLASLPGARDNRLFQTAIVLAYTALKSGNGPQNDRIAAGLDAILRPGGDRSCETIRHADFRAAAKLFRFLRRH